MGGGSNDATFLDSWKKEGILKVWAHREPPWERRLHSFRQVILDESGKTPKKTIKWHPFVCWEEDESYHRERAKWRKGYDVSEPRAPKCPMCRLVEYFEAAEDIEHDDVIFEFVAGREKRQIIKGDFIGQGKSRDSYQDSGLPKSEYIMAVIPADNPDGVYLANETWTLGQKLHQRIKKDIAMLGDDGNPETTPICYTFEFDKSVRGSGAYGVSRFPEAELTEAIQELWDGPAPDAGPFTEPSDPKKLFDSVQDGIVYDDIPIDELFAPAIEAWEAKSKETESPPPDDEEEEKPQKKTRTRKAKEEGEKPQRKTRSRKAKAEKEEEKPQKKTRSRKAKAEKEEEKPQKKTRSRKAKKEEPPPPPPEDEEGDDPVCEECGGVWPEDEPACPSCGAEAADEIPFA
jgi:hypothetical protein